MTNSEDRAETAKPDFATRSAAELQQSPRLGRSLDRRGSVALLAGAVCLTGTFSGGVFWWLIALQLVIGSALVGFGAWALVRGRRHLARVVPGIRFLPADERIVLYLRSFSDDAGFARMGGLRIRNVVKNVLKGGPTLADLRTEEQQVAHGVAAFGRMVALGKPSGGLPRVGAERSYVSNEQWQDEVLAGLDRATLTLLAAGPGEGLEWEVDQVLRRDPARLVIVISRDRSQYARFRESVQENFPKGLPDYPEPRARHRLVRGPYVRAVIWFDPDWTPHLEMLDGRDPLGGAGTRTQRALLRALSPVYARAGVPVPRKNRPTNPRPKQVVLGVVLFNLSVPTFMVTFGSGAFICVALFVPVPGSISRFGILIEAFMILLVFGFPLVLWMRQVLRGGPFAILMLQVAGILQGLGMLIIFLIVQAFTSISDDMNPGVAPVESSLMPLLAGLCLVAMLAPPAAARLFLRRDVREWIESRT